MAKRRTTDIRSLARQLKGELEWITMRALEKDPGRRYASASEFAADVSRHLHGEPVIAAPPSATYRLAKLIRRYRGPFAAAAAVMAVALIGFAVSGVLYVREQSARVGEAEQRAEAEWQSYVANVAAVCSTSTTDRPREAAPSCMPDVPQPVLNSTHSGRMPVVEATDQG